MRAIPIEHHYGAYTLGAFASASKQRSRVLAAAYAATPERFITRAARPARAPQRRLDQQAHSRGGRSLNLDPNRLKRLDRLRSRWATLIDDLRATPPDCRLAAYLDRAGHRLEDV